MRRLIVLIACRACSCRRLRRPAKRSITSRRSSRSSSPAATRATVRCERSRGCGSIRRPCSSKAATRARRSSRAKSADSYLIRHAHGRVGHAHAARGRRRGADGRADRALQAVDRRRRARARRNAAARPARPLVVSSAGAAGCADSRRTRPGFAIRSMRSSPPGTSRTGLSPVAAADKATLLRRVYLDLDRPAADARRARGVPGRRVAEAYEEVVDRLLASPQYGERWARHWMDVWRYSDWAGYKQEIRNSARHIWRWRDWIVESLNADKGYDRMVDRDAGRRRARADRSEHAARDRLPGPQLVQVQSQRRGSRTRSSTRPRRSSA